MRFPIPVWTPIPMWIPILAWTPILALPLLLTLPAPAWGQVEGVPPGQEEEVLVVLDQRLFETLILDQDPELLLSVSDSSYVEVAPGGVIETREEIIRDLWGFTTVDSITVEPEGFIPQGATAVVLSRLAIHGPVQGPIGEIGPIRVMTVFTRVDGRGWQVVSRAYSTCDPEAVALGLC
jgi:hypothetical protein